MPKTIIEQKPSFSKTVEGNDKLSIAEMFCDTIQGEGISTGVPSTFLRLQGCTLLCTWCDTLDVWDKGNEYSFDEIFIMLEQNGMIRKLKDGQRLILTGGSPLKQQTKLIKFIDWFINAYDFKPYIEVENECVLEPLSQMIGIVDQWNNSPKLSNSGMKERVRYKPEILKKMGRLHNSWFKFVVNTNEDWQEIVKLYLDPNLISLDQIILMPQGQTRDELELTRAATIELAIKYNVRYCDRAHVTAWNKKTGV